MNQYFPKKKPDADPQRKRPASWLVKGTAAKKSYGNTSNVSSSRKKITYDEDDDEGNDVDDTELFQLSDSQLNAIKAVLNGQSIFFTGAAGTGKSYVLHILKKIFSKEKRSSSVAFTAPTGVAACNIGGLTIHAWAGIGVGKESGEILVGKIKGNRLTKKRWQETDVLIIDEISMLSHDIFDLLSFIGQKVRNDPRPFGGIQLILCGDFFQLPPIGLGSKIKFCFESEIWKQMFSPISGSPIVDNASCGRMVVLDKIFRQKDTTFLRILNEVRRGVVSKDTARIFTQHVTESKRKDEDPNRKMATRLFSTNKDVDRTNKVELEKLINRADPSTFEIYEANDSTLPQVVSLLNGLRAPAKLELCIGAEVSTLLYVSMVMCV